MHPLFSDPSTLTDKELADKIFDLSRKISLSYRMGNAYLVGQADMIMQQLTEEQSRRQQKELSELMSKHGKKFDDIIDIK
jgi:fructose 1,6-bisphosphatase